MRPSKGASGYLLDTNVILHSAMAPNKLGKNTVRILEENPHVYFSPVSITEIEIKSLRGKLPEFKNLYENLTSQEFLEKPYLSKHAGEVRTFPSLADHDPYDRMLLAQASAENLTLITADKKLLDLNLSWVCDAGD
jgi:PIN domain nuclease of toxin-antitoxin system